MSREVVDAINDMTRVMIALNGKFATKADAVRHLHNLSIPPTRIAAILAMEPKKVHTVLSREKKKQAKNTEGGSDGQ